MKNITVIKVGGKVISDASLLASFLSDFSKIDGLKILVHGGGNHASQLSNQLGIEHQMVEGRRVTSKEMLEVAIMSYAGINNKKVVAKLQQLNCNALGLSGADAQIIQSKKRDTNPIDYGYVGDVKGVNVDSLIGLLNLGITPVFCALSFDKDHGLLNTNADTIASEIACALSKRFQVKLMYCFEKEGVLENMKDEESVIECLSEFDFYELMSKNLIYEGMIPKLQTAYNASKQKVHQVIIGSAKNVLQQKGTLIVA